MDEKVKKQKKRFQENLSLIRKAAGWSEVELAEKLDVTRQTISNLERFEKSGVAMSTIQYIAIRALLNDEILKETNCNTEKEDTPRDTDLLVCILQTLVDEPEKYSEDEKNRIKSMANMLTPAIINKTNTKIEVAKVLRDVGIAVGAIVTGITISYFFRGKGGKQ